MCSVDGREKDESGTTTCYVARWIMPIERPPIHGGHVLVSNGRVVEVGCGQPATRFDHTVRLDDHAILPGLVNAHTHLEFSDLTEPIGRDDSGKSRLSLDRWITEVIAHRQSAQQAPPSDRIAKGIAETSATGTRLIGEISTGDEDTIFGLMRAPSGTEVIAFSEVIGLSQARWQQRLAAAQAVTAKDPHAGYSPHAPYSLSTSGLQATLQAAIGDRRPIAMHVAESPDERLLLETGRGPFAESLRDLGVYRDGLFPWPGDWLDSGATYGPLLKFLLAAHSVLLVHGNDLNDTEISVIARHQHASVVYCPRTHAYFEYPTHPVARLLNAGVRVALGTDSRASNPDLNLWREIQHLLRHRQDLSPHDVIRMGTVWGGEAMGRKDVGRLATGATPRLGTVVTTANTVDALYRDLADGDYQPVL